MIKYHEPDHLMGSIMFLPDGSMGIGCFDTMSQVMLGNADRRPADAVPIGEDDGTVVEGVGGSRTPAGQLWRCHVSIRVGCPPIPVDVRMVPLKGGILFLWGITEMREVLGATYDTVRNLLPCRVPALGYKEVLRLEPVKILAHRLRQPPIQSMSACGGMATDLVSRLEMGIRVSKFVLIDPDERAHMAGADTRCTRCQCAARSERREDIDAGVELCTCARRRQG